MSQKVIVIGIGEVGGPLLELVRQRYQAFAVDINLSAPISECDIMHLCFPYTDESFVEHAVCYIAKYRPALTVINSTVAIGTTRKIATASGAKIVYSPVRGKHARMKEEMLRYVKFVGALDDESGARACEHFSNIGMRPKRVGAPETVELAKLTETTYFGLLIAWAQEVERYCAHFGVSYDEVVSFYDEIRFFPPVRYMPGVIGGHCVMPNLKILTATFKSGMLEAIQQSNTIKTAGAGVEAWS